MEKRAEYENFWAKNEEGAFSIADHIGDKQWEFVEELKRKYGFEELDDNDETVVTLRKGKIIVKTDFGYPNEVANNLIKYFFWIENEK
ncbi:MAG: hypothetical protein C0175_03760 [Caldisericum exile]|uniref:Uncharacterized protein n=1 Tax=Caldisericum exile TaxID=693075 RepID=A0A2J6X6D2_9BACT|nr:MAG: hypothetical protein C0175_03760 [Caldisericum exile]